MSFMKAYEISCDFCGNADYATECSKKEAARQYRELGGIVTAKGYVYCDKECREKGRLSEASHD
jgi:hypothetical protein